MTMKMIVDVRAELSDEELLKSIRKAMQSGSMYESGIVVTVLDNPDQDEVLAEFYSAGVEVIDMTPYMYDGSLFDLEDSIAEMPRNVAESRLAKISKIIDILHGCTDELNFERALLYREHNVW
jgi:hypothetical protein